MAQRRDGLCEKEEEMFELFINKVQPVPIPEMAPSKVTAKEEW